MNDNELTTTPVAPSEGAADPQTGVGPATADPIEGETKPESESDNLTHPALEYKRLDKAIHDLGGIIIHTVDDLIPLLAEMKKVLSRKACTRKDKDGLPMWGDYLDDVAAEFSLSKRTLLRKLHDLEHANEVKSEQNDTRGGRGKREEKVSVVEESLASQLCKEGAHLARLIKNHQVSREALIKWADKYLAKLHDSSLVKEGDPLLDPAPPVAWLRKVINEHHPDNKLRVVPLHLREANSLVAKLHRHHSPIRVAKFSIGVALGDNLIGAAICMRPASRALDDGKTIEVARVAVEEPTDGPTDPRRNACSFLYGACARIAREMGFSKIQSYILDSEPGESVRGAGWMLEKTGCGGTPQGNRTNRPNGHEVTETTFTKKQRWAKVFGKSTDKEAVTEDIQKRPVADIRVLSPCGGCKDMHAGIAKMAKDKPGMSDAELAAKSGCDLTIVRQAKVRFLDWKETA